MAAVSQKGKVGAVGDLQTNDEVLLRAVADFRELAREAGIVDTVSMSGAGNPAVVNAAERAENWYRGAAGTMATLLGDFSRLTVELMDTFDSTDKGLSTQATTNE